MYLNPQHWYLNTGIDSQLPNQATNHTVVLTLKLEYKVVSLPRIAPTHTDCFTGGAKQNSAYSSYLYSEVRRRVEESGGAWEEGGVGTRARINKQQTFK